MPSKFVPKTPYELMTRRPTLKHFRVWGCKAEHRPYNQETEKLDPKTIFGFFVGYNIESRGCKFYYLNHTTIIIESHCAIYLEGNLGDDSIMQQYPVEFREEHVDIPFPIEPIIGTILSDLVHNDVTDPIIDIILIILLKGIFQIHMLLSLRLEDQEEFLHLRNLPGSRIILCVCWNMSLILLWTPILFLFMKPL